MSDIKYFKERFKWYDDYLNAVGKYRVTKKEKEEIRKQYLQMHGEELDEITKSHITAHRRFKIRLLNGGYKEITLRNLGIGKDEAGYTFKGYISNKLKNQDNDVIYEEDYKEVTDLFIDKAENISIEDISKYPGYFRCRFFYGIFDKEKNIGWVRYNGLSIDEFMIEINIQKEGFLDCCFGDIKGVFTDIRNRMKRDSLKDLSFKYKSDKLYDTGELYKILLRLGASEKLIRLIIERYKYDWRGNTDYKNLFYSQLKFLKDLIIDEDREKLREHPSHNVNRKYFEKYGYLPEEKYKESYNNLVKYFGVENKVLLYKNDLDFTKKITNITDFKDRKKLIFEEYKKLFPNEKLNHEMNNI